MALETATYINDLNTSNPTGTDAKAQGDDHIRLIKSAVKATFPNVTGAVTPTQTELNYVAGVTSAIQTQLNSKLSSVPDASVTQGKLANNVAGNGPAFRAVNSISQSISATTYTKVALQTEQIDTNNNFDNATNYRFQPTVAGYYQLNGSIMNGGSTANSYMQLIIYKNGSAFKTVITHTSNASVDTLTINDLIQFNGSSDYVELWVYFGFGGGIAIADFSGFLARAA